MQQKYLSVIFTLLVLVISGCGSTPKYSTPDSKSIYQPEIKKPPPPPIPADILQKYKRIRSITGEIIHSDPSYILVQKE
jgi:uncharacterized lipoprotein